MLSILKTIGSFIGAYKLIIAIVGALGILTTVYFHIRNDGIRDTRLAHYETQLEAQETALKSKQATIRQQQIQIDKINAANAAALAAAEARVFAARQMAKRIHEQNEAIQHEVGVLRFELLEAMRDDEDYADWAYAPVSINAWCLLNAAANPGALPTDHCH